MNRILQEDFEILSAKLDSTLVSFERVVVLGCTGMLGFYITQIFAQYYSKKIQKSFPTVIGVSRNQNRQIETLLRTYPKTFKHIKFHQIESNLEKSFRTLVIHAASPSSIQRLELDHYGAIYTNIELTILISKLISRSGGHLVFLSSGEVYGDQATVPTDEKSYSGIDHLSKRGTYPELKRAAEVILKLYCTNEKAISGASLRVFHTFGPGINIDDPRIFGLVCKAIYLKKPIELDSDGSTIRTFMYSRDLISALLFTIEVGGFQEYNVAGTEPLSILEFCDLSLSLGVPKIVFNVLRDPLPRNLQIGVADTSKLASLGWRAEVTTKEALARTVSSLD